MTDRAGSERVETLVIGGGQAGLAMGYHLSRRGLPYAIVDGNDRIGDAWRNRWDSLRLFTPNRLNGLPGMPFPGYHWGFPSKNEMADYLENYARHFDMPVETGVRVEKLSREGDGFVAIAGDRRFVADHVVVAMSSWQRPRVPDFANQLDQGIVQLHAAEYKNPGQLREGRVLVVGAGNSGAEIAKELARTHDVWLSGPDTGKIPFRPESVVARVLMPFIGRVVFHRILSTSTPIGRKARPKMIASGEPLLRVKPKDLAEAGVERVPRVTRVQGGQPQLEDGRRLDVANVSGAPAFVPGTPGSISRDWGLKGRTTTEVSSIPSPGSTSWVSSSSTRSRQSRSTVWDVTRLTSRTPLRRDARTTLIDRQPTGRANSSLPNPDRASRVSTEVAPWSADHGVAEGGLQPEVGN